MLSRFRKFSSNIPKNFNYNQEITLLCGYAGAGCGFAIDIIPIKNKTKLNNYNFKNIIVNTIIGGFLGLFFGHVRMMLIPMGCVIGTFHVLKND